MGKLTTHVLDTAQGKPAAGVILELHAVEAGRKTLIKSLQTDADGRCGAPLLSQEEMRAGTYEIVFYAGDYFAKQGMALPEPRFIDQVAIRFGIADAQQNYHVPLVVSPWSYSTYRGS